MSSVFSERKLSKFHDGQYRSIVPFMLYADFESIIRPVDEQYRQKMDQIKADEKGKTSYTKHKHACSVWMVCEQHLCLCRRFLSIKKVPR